MAAGGGPEERKKVGQCSTTCSNYIISNKQTKSFVTSIILFGQKVSVRVYPQLWEDFKRIAKVEGLSLSHLGEKAVIEYVRRHNLGNPQLHLTTYMDPLAPSPMRVLCWSSLAGATSDGQIYCRKHGGWIQGIRCYSCPNNQLRKKKKET